MSLEQQHYYTKKEIRRVERIVRQRPEEDPTAEGYWTDKMHRFSSRHTPANLQRLCVLLYRRRNGHRRLRSMTPDEYHHHLDRVNASIRAVEEEMVPIRQRLAGLEQEKQSIEKRLSFF